MVGLMAALLFSAGLLAQSEEIVLGQILDKYSRQAVAGATVVYKNTRIATESNNEGYFLLRSDGNFRVVEISAKGYKNYKIRLQKHRSATVNVLLTPLSPSELPLEQVIEDPFSLRLMQQVIQHKPVNNPSKFYQPSTLSEKLKAYVYHVPPSWIKSQDMRTSTFWSADSLVTFPVYSSDKIYRQPQFPAARSDKNILFEKVSTLSPLDKEYVLKMVGLLVPHQNFYDEHVVIVGKYFISPLAGNSSKYYSFFLQDSTLAGDRKYYTIGFRPKKKESLLLSGTLVVDSLSSALVEINATLPHTLSLNFVNTLTIRQTFSYSRGRWYYNLVDESLVLHLSQASARSSKPLLGVIDKELRFALPQADSGDMRKLEAARGLERQPRSDSLYRALDNMNDTRFMTKTKWVTDLLMYQYAHAGKIDVGPFNSLFHNNLIDGPTVALGLRTNERMWKNFSIGGDLGYAYKNESWKFGGQLQYRLPTRSFQQVELSYSKNAYRTGYNENIFLVNEQKVSPSDDNAFASLLRYNPNTAINEIAMWAVRYQREWTREFKTTATLFGNRLYSNPYVTYVHNGQEVPSILTKGFRLDFRFSQDQLVWNSFYGRRFLSNYKPVFHVQFEGGHFEFAQTGGNYLKVHATARQTIPFPGGTLYYTAEAGYIAGRVPFPLLEIERGNETYIFSDYNFNLMHYLEYAGDKYIHFHADYYTTGWLLKVLPLIRSLGWREVLSLKMADNGLRGGHGQMLDLPEGIGPLKTPYVEAGAGVYNIFSCLGFQSVWRVTHRNDPLASNWGLRAFFYLNF
jgi:hypothetical protein